MDAKIYAAHVRGLTPRGIGERLQLPTEYVERRLPHLSTHSLAGMRPETPTLADRILDLLKEADGHAATVDDLTALHVPKSPGSSAVNAVRVSMALLRADGHEIQYVHRYVADAQPHLESTSRVMRRMADRLAAGPATPEELTVAGRVPIQQVRVYVHKLKRKGAQIRQVRAYVLTVVNEESQS
ncbi:hypothetical protein NS365_05450 [Aureimonas ureilytica]|uniref:Uncharacterized protein n=1 Tax=Aureimonas ureilytica TaxID=401562 RepID=A0A175RT17_9HYPH|nr:hypothetical protein [Aureimonas ureilytica]KTR06880.1 hypothetical protein NS365_05450 [Aureimonas ureilytica]